MAESRRIAERARRLHKRSIALAGHATSLALALGVDPLLRAQGRLHGAAIHAANLCASANNDPPVSEADAMRAIDALERDAGQAINRWADGGARLAPGAVARFESAELERLLAPRRGAASA